MLLLLGVRPQSLRWESRVQDTGPPETSWLHVISNGKSSPRDLSLNTKTQLHSTTSRLQCWTPYAKQLADMNTTPPISREAAWNHNKVTDTPKHTTRCGPAHHKDKIQPHPPDTGTSPLHWEAYTIHRTNPSKGGRHQKQWELRTCSLQKGDPKHSKFSKMRRQRNTQHVKEQGKNPPDQTNEEEIGSLREKEFRVMIVKMIQNLGNRMEKIQETLNKDLEELKSKQTMMNNTRNEI